MQDGETVILQYSMPRVSLPPVELTRENITGFFSFYYQRAGWIWDTSAFPSCISKTPFGKTVQLDSQTWWPRPDRKTLCHSLSPCKQQTFPPLLQEIPTAWALGCKTNFAYFDHSPWGKAWCSVRLVLVTPGLQEHCTPVTYLGRMPQDRNTE